jgi:DNA mismatch endonuclease (patch repair protein)
MDKLSEARRSENMRQIRSKDMAPEVAVRRMVHALGFRFRLHRRDLPGAPDLVLPRLKKVIFVHGCFWHQHSGCREGRFPGTRQDYWRPKLLRNVERDAENAKRIRALGWTSLTVWECELKDAATVRERLTRFLRPQSRRQIG